MSVSMVASAHVDAIVHAAMVGTGPACDRVQLLDDSDGLVRLGRDRLPTEMGRMLLRANAEAMAMAMAERYEMKDLSNPADGGTRPIEYLQYLEQADRHEYNMLGDYRRYSVGEVLRAIDGYAYQVYEYAPAVEGEVSRFLDAVERVLMRRTPEYLHAETRSIEDRVVLPVGSLIEEI